LAIVLLALWYRPRKPLVVAGTFGLVYGLVRIVGEEFRVPDEHLGYLFSIRIPGLMNWHVTQGQLLSVPLAIAGLVLIIVGSRRDVPKMGGWGSRNEGREAKGGGRPTASPS
jgi:phosphatidylglycerol:prolipoprotein diacylglycerol transferase